MEAKITVIYNVSHVEYPGARIWCHGITIDNTREETLVSRQLRGFTYGGMPVFTIWLNDAEVKIKNRKGGNIVMPKHDDKILNMDSGVEINFENSAGEPGIILAIREDPRQSIKICQAEKQPFGDSADMLILPYCGGINYPKVVWLPKHMAMQKVF